MNTEPRSSSPIRASYGEKNNMHTLLSCSGDEHTLPAALAGFTDKPQGHLGPGERWWPSVGCGPFGDWWAIWWSIPDDRATRAGMARAEVAIWPIENVSEIDDLGAVLESLNGGVPIPAAAPDMLAAVADALMRDNQVPLIADLDVWPGILAGLWPRLWPGARRDFSAWVTLSPPQVGDSKYIPWLYAVPSGREKQWPSHVLVNPIDSQAISRGARWLMGEKDATVDELIAECPFPNGSVKHLNRIARAAERLDRVRSSPDAASGTELARTLAAIDPTPTGALQLKHEALRAVRMNLAAAPLSAIRSIANLDAVQYPADAMPSTALQEWIAVHLPDLAPGDLSNVLNLFATGRAKPWWLDAFRSALRAGLAGLTPAWCKVALFWICSGPDLVTLSSNIVDSAKLETGVVGVFAHSELTEERLQTLRQTTYALGWSRLHAITVWCLLPPVKAIKEQLQFPVTPWDGIEVLLQRAPDEDLVHSAVELEDRRLQHSCASVDCEA